MPSKLHVTVWKGKSHTLGRCIGNVDIILYVLSPWQICLVQVHVQTINFRLFGLKEFADDNFEFNENSRKFLKQVENTVEKREIAFQEQYLLFPWKFQKTCTADTNQGLCRNFRVNDIIMCSP